MSTVFEQIIARKIPATIVYEDDHFIAFHDLHPKAPIHVLLVPKTAHPTLETIPLEDDTNFHQHLLTTARRVAALLKIADNYQIHLNIGPDIQKVPHLHLHILGGWNKKQLAALE